MERNCQFPDREIPDWPYYSIAEPFRCTAPENDYGRGKGNQKWRSMMQHKVLQAMYPEHMLRPVVEPGLHKKVNRQDRQQKCGCAPETGGFTQLPGAYHAPDIEDKQRRTAD